MTPEERLAGKRLEHNELGAYSDPDGAFVFYHDAIAAIREAVAAEREACAALLEKMDPLGHHMSDLFAKAIRARP